MYNLDASREPRSYIDPLPNDTDTGLLVSLYEENWNYWSSVNADIPIIKADNSTSPKKLRLNQVSGVFMYAMH